MRKTSSQECSQVVAKVEGHIFQKLHLSAAFGLLHTLIGLVNQLLIYFSIIAVIAFRALTAFGQCHFFYKDGAATHNGRFCTGCITQLCFQNLPMCHIGNCLVS
jgi:hypothetical protein